MEQAAMSADAVLEIYGRDGQVRAVHKVAAWPLRIGRSPVCDVVIDDAHLAPQHAQIDWTDAGPQLQLLPSLNGGWLEGQALREGQAVDLPAAAQFQLGATQLRLRSSLDTLAEELPLSESERHAALPAPARRLVVLALALAWLAILGFDQWLSLNPGSPWIDYSSALLGPFMGLLAWAALCSLVTQLFRHRFPFALHMRRALIGAISLQFISVLLPALAYAFSWPLLLTLELVLTGIGFTALLWWHAVVVWPRAGRGLAVAFASLLLVSTGLTVAKRMDQQHWLGPAYMSQLPPPALRMVSPKPVKALIDELRPLEAQLARQARKDEDSASDEPDAD
jgi:hypothetical protein